jgi:hypothetical protein
MTVGAGRTQLYTAMKTCTERWDQTRETWRDGVAADFEENCLVPLQGDVKAVLHALDRLGDVLSAMQRDCE